MKKTMIALAAAASLFAAVAVPTSADASHRSWHRGATIAGAIIGGAIIAGALAPRYRPYAEAEGNWEPYEGYSAAYPVDCPGGYWAREPIAFNRYGEPVRWSRPRFFCPAY